MTIHQGTYARKILSQYNLDHLNATGIPMETTVKLTKNQCEDKELDGSKLPYREIIGALMYLVTTTRPDLAYAVGQLSRFVANPGREHYGALKKLLRYLSGTLDLGLKFRPQMTPSLDVQIQLTGYCDSDWAGDIDTRKSVTGYVLTIAGTAISWYTKKQGVTAQSTAEAEYVACCQASMESKGLKNILDEILVRPAQPIEMYVDNQAAVTMVNNPTFTRRTRHIEMKWHYVRDLVAQHDLVIKKIATDKNAADMFTKPMTKAKLELFREIIGMVRCHDVHA